MDLSQLQSENFGEQFSATIDIYTQLVDFETESGREIAREKEVRKWKKRSKPGILAKDEKSK